MSLTGLEVLEFNSNLPDDMYLRYLLGEMNALSLVTLKVPPTEVITMELLDEVAQLTALQDLDLSSHLFSVSCPSTKLSHMSFPQPLKE